MKVTYLTAPLCLLALTACGSLQEATTPITEKSPLIHYSCENDVPLTVRYETAVAIVTLPDGQTVSLPQKPTPSGTWFTSGRHDLRLDGDRAMWSVGRSATVLCTVENR